MKTVSEGCVQVEWEDAGRYQYEVVEVRVEASPARGERVCDGRGSSREALLLRAAAQAAAGQLPWDHNTSQSFKETIHHQQTSRAHC